MGYTNYADLQESIANYIGRTDLANKIPDFIQFAEIRISRDLRTRQMLLLATAPTVATEAKVSLPSDFLEIRDIHVQGSPRFPVTYMSPSVFSRNARADESGKPVNYTILASEFVLAPIPDAVYTLEILYYAKPPVLSNANISNLFLANYPDALLYASLLEAEPYLINDARAQTWTTLYERAIQKIITTNQNGEYSGVPLQMTITSR